MNEVCPVCSWDATEPYYKHGSLQLVRCSQCALVRRDPLPVAHEVLRLEAHLAVGEINEAAEKFRAQIIVNNAKKFVEQGRWLDIGCGSGALLVAALEAGFAVHGVESAPAPAHHASEHFDLDVAAGSLREARFPAASLDVVSISGALERALDPLDLLEEIKNILKPGGYLFVEVGNVVATRSLGDEKQIGEILSDARRALYFAPATLRSVVEKAGFAVQETPTHARADYQPQVSGWRKAASGILNRVGLPELIGIVAQKS